MHDGYDLGRTSAVNDRNIVDAFKRPMIETQLPQTICPVPAQPYAFTMIASGFDEVTFIEHQFHCGSGNPALLTADIRMIGVGRALVHVHLLMLQQFDIPQGCQKRSGNASGTGCQKRTPVRLQGPFWW